MEPSAKKIHILDVAEELFSEQGFDGTSVRSIAKKAGANIAMISYYFGSKEKLLQELILRRNEGLGDAILKVQQGEYSYSEKLDFIIATFVKQVHQNRRIHKILHFEFSNGHRNINFETFIEQKNENFRLMSSFIEEGQEAGAFAKNVNIKLMVPTILGTYFHFIFNKKFYQKFLGLGAGQTLDHFVYGELTSHIQQTIKALLQNEN